MPKTQRHCAGVANTVEWLVICENIVFKFDPDCHLAGIRDRAGEILSAGIAAPSGNPVRESEKNDEKPRHEALFSEAGNIPLRYGLNNTQSVLVSI